MLDQIKQLEELVPSVVPVDASTQSYDVHVHTLLMCAAAHGSIECLKYLIQNGTDVNKKNFAGYTALHWTAYTGRIECVDELLSHGAKIETKTEDGRTPVHIAAERGHVKYIEAIVAKGADLNAVNSDGWTAMHYAVVCNQRNVAKYLMQNNIDYTGPDVNMKTIDSLVEEYGRTWFASVVNSSE